MNRLTILIFLLPSLVHANTQYLPHVLLVVPTARVQDLAVRAETLPPADVRQALWLIEDLRHFQNLMVPEAEMIAAIKLFAHFYVNQFEPNPPMIELAIDGFLLRKIAAEDPRAIIRRTAERAQREIIRRLQARALDTVDDSVFKEIIYNLKNLKTSEAVDALAFIATTEHRRYLYRATYTRDVLVGLAQEKDFAALIEKCREILGGKTANQEILEILGERGR